MSTSSRLLTAGDDYPRNWSQFLDWFSDDEACLEYLAKLRWGDAFVCPKCGHAARPYYASRQRIMCRACRHQTSVTAGTIFEKTRTHMRDWFAAAWYITSQKNGISALGLQKALGLKSYQTAWAILHRLRHAMVIPGRDKLSGIIEVDETFILDFGLIG